MNNYGVEILSPSKMREITMINKQNQIEKELLEVRDLISSSSEYFITLASLSDPVAYIFSEHGYKIDIVADQWGHLLHYKISWGEEETDD